MIDSAPVLLMIGPLLAALATWLSGRWPRITAVIGTAALAVVWLLVLRATDPVTTLFGRELMFTESVRQIGQWVYGGMAVLFLLSVAWPVGPEFVPGNLAALAFLVTALMIRPFSFGIMSLLLAITLLVAVAQAGRAGYTRAGLRLLVLTVLTLPLFLLATWIIETNQTSLFPTVSRLLGIGFIMLLAGFPFHLWVTPLVADSASLATAVFFGPVQLVMVAFVGSIMQEHSWLMQDGQLGQWLSWSGMTTAVLAGFIAYTAPGFGRLWGGLVLLDLGFGLVAMSVTNTETAVMLPITRFAALLLVGLALLLYNHRAQPDEWTNHKGLGRMQPITAMLFVYGCLSFVGLPLTVGYNARWAILVALSTRSPWLVVLLLAAMMAALYGVLRGAVALFENPVIE